MPYGSSIDAVHTGTCITTVEVFCRLYGKASSPSALPSGLGSAITSSSDKIGASNFMPELQVGLNQVRGS
jgi:hypothetical protein